MEARQKSISQEWREKGNKLYRSDSKSLAYILRKKRLEEAVGCYLNAVDTTVNKEEMTSACKNTAIASARLAGLYVAREKASLDVQIKHYITVALKHFARAVADPSCQTDDWVSKLYESMKQCFDDSYEWASNKPTTKRQLLIEEFVQLLPDGAVKADGHIILATFLFHSAVVATQDREFKLSLKYLADCYYPVEEAKRWSGSSPELDIEIRVLEADIILQNSVARSLQAKSTGDGILKDTLEKMETLNMDMVWDVLDWYQNAIILTRGNDVELEAEITARIGYVYDKILKQKAKAHSAYMDSMNLVQVLYPKNLGHTDWFKEASIFLEAYQQERMKRQEEREEAEKAPIKQKLKKELEKLHKQRHKEVDDILKFVYKTWPPKNQAHQRETSGSEKRKLQKALQHYHPDTQDKEKHGMTWIVMSEEITKVLTEKYNCIKCVD